MPSVNMVAFSAKLVDRGAGRPGQLLRHVSDPKRWKPKVLIGRDVNGKRQYLSEVVHGSKRDAKRG
jgi:hypothetical protein